MKNKLLRSYLVIGFLSIFLVVVVVLGCMRERESLHLGIDDTIGQVDLDTIVLGNGKVEVNFADVILSDHEESRKLIISTQRGTVSTQLTERLIKQFDFDFLKKTQTVSYTGTGYFVVDLDMLTAGDIVQDTTNKTVTIHISHAYLQAIEINPNDIIIDEVKEGLLARGDIKLTVADYQTIEKELRNKLEAKFNTAENGQAADVLALQMVKEIFQPIIKAIDQSYEVIVVFQEKK